MKFNILVLTDEIYYFKLLENISCYNNDNLGWELRLAL